MVELSKNPRSLHHELLVESGVGDAQSAQCHRQNQTNSKVHQSRLSHPLLCLSAQTNVATRSAQLAQHPQVVVALGGTGPVCGRAWRGAGGALSL